MNNFNLEEFRSLFDYIWLESKCLNKRDTMPEMDFKEEVFKEALNRMEKMSMKFAVFGEAVTSKNIIKGEDLVKDKENSLEEDKKKEAEEDGKTN